MTMMRLIFKQKVFRFKEKTVAEKSEKLFPRLGLQEETVFSQANDKDMINLAGQFWRELDFIYKSKKLIKKVSYSKKRLTIRHQIFVWELRITFASQGIPSQERRKWRNSMPKS